MCQSIYQTVFELAGFGAILFTTSARSWLQNEAVLSVKKFPWWMVLNFISSLHLVVLARLLLTIKKMPVICYMFQYFKIFLLSVFLISAFLGVANWGVCSSTLWYPECLIDCISIVLASTASNLSVSFLCHSLQWNLKSGLYRESERERERKFFDFSDLQQIYSKSFSKLWIYCGPHP